MSTPITSQADLDRKIREFVAQLEGQRIAAHQVLDVQFDRLKAEGHLRLQMLFRDVHQVTSH